MSLQLLRGSTVIDFGDGSVTVGQPMAEHTYNSKLPELGKGLGQGIRSLKDSVKELRKPVE